MVVAPHVQPLGDGSRKHVMPKVCGWHATGVTGQQRLQGLLAKDVDAQGCQKWSLQGSVHAGAVELLQHCWARLFSEIRNLICGKEGVIDKHYCSHGLLFVFPNQKYHNPAVCMT